MMRASYLLLTNFLSFVPATLWAQGQQIAAQDSTVKTLPNGIVATSADTHEEITALRDDVLRIRVWRGNNEPEDASWAVLTEARRASVPVNTADSGDRFEIRTKSLIADVDKASLKISIRDLAGSILQQDARPIRFDGDSFRIYKSMPHFMAYRAGRAIGVLLDNTWRSNFDFGKESPDAYSFGAVAGPIDYYVFLGPTPKQVVETYAWLTGTPPLPPLWALGYQQSRYSYMTQDRVL